jgi:phosphatidylethanolamine/phosphatidyl-N-methylethanolamine N-methyltransferase
MSEPLHRALRSPRNSPASVEAIYSRLAPAYDLIYGALLQHGRRCAISRLAPMPGESILEVGVGTGLSGQQYPSGCQVTAIDLSAPMLERARRRFARQRIDHVRLCRMDAARLAFADAHFHAVYASYVLNVVPDPVQVVREMLRVCRPEGRIVLLNHFQQLAAKRQILDRVIGRLAKSISGVNWDLDLESFLSEAGLVPLSVERVNIPRVSSVVVCRRAVGSTMA